MAKLNHEGRASVRPSLLKIMADTCETVRIKSAASPDGVVVINKEDFDPARHQLADEVAPVEITAAEAAAPKPKAKK